MKTGGEDMTFQEKRKCLRQQHDLELFVFGPDHQGLLNDIGTGGLSYWCHKNGSQQNEISEINIYHHDGSAVFSSNIQCRSVAESSIRQDLPFGTSLQQRSVHFLNITKMHQTELTALLAKAGAHTKQ